MTASHGAIVVALFARFFITTGCISMAIVRAALTERIRLPSRGRGYSVSSHYVRLLAYGLYTFD
jgi:hypothetical protein